MPGVTAPVLSGEANGPEEDNALSVHRGEQHLRHELTRQLRPELGIHEVGFAFVFEFENGGLEPPVLIGVHPDEPLPVRLADRHGQDRLPDAHLVREILRETQAVEVERFLVIGQLATPCCRCLQKPSAT